MIRVLIADDHRAVRAGLEQLLQTATDIEVVGSAADGRQAVLMAADQRPDVVLMDLLMPVMDGIGATRQIVAARPETRVLIHTCLFDRDRIQGALDAGAVGHVLMDREPKDLLAEIRSASRRAPTRGSGR